MADSLTSEVKHLALTAEGVAELAAALYETDARRQELCAAVAQTARPHR